MLNSSFNTCNPCKMGFKVCDRNPSICALDWKTSPTPYFHYETQESCFRTLTEG